MSASAQLPLRSHAASDSWIIEIPSAPSSIAQIIEREGLGEYLISFFDDASLSNLSSTCVSLNQLLLTDDLWRERIKKTQIIALFQIANDPNQIHLYSRYAKYMNSDERDYERGVRWASEIAPRCIRFYSVRGLSSEEISRTLQQRNKTAILGLLSIFFLCVGVMSFKEGMNHNSFENRLASFASGAYSLLATGLYLPICMHQAGVSQQIGGSSFVLKKKISRSAKSCCSSTNRRVTTCWQAFQRGIQRIKNWCFSKPHYS